MSPFSRLVNRIVLVARATSKNLFGAERKTDVSVVPFSTIPYGETEQSNFGAGQSMLPQELYERIIDHLHDNVLSLSACSLVCRAWVPASRYHLFSQVAVRPLKLTWPRHIAVNCAVSLLNKHILYGSDDGIYFSQTPKTVPMRTLYLPDPVYQIDVLEDFGLVVFLSDQQLFSIQLNALRSGHPKGISSCIRISSHVSFIARGIISGKHLVCAVKAGNLSTTCKLLEPVFSPTTRTFALRLFKDFYISERVLSLNFLNTKIVAGTGDHDFELIDVETLATQPLLDPDSALPKQSVKCVATLRTSQGVLVCYNSIAVVIDREGRPSGSLIQWRNSSIHDVVFRNPYVVAFGAKHFEIYDMETGWRAQTVRTDYKLLSTTSGLLIIQTQDGQLLGLQFRQP